MTMQGVPSILVVEDNPSQQMVIRLLLEKFGFYPLIVETGQAAIDSVSCCSSFSAILMDIKLTDMDGYECTRSIRALEGEHNRRVPIIAVTAQAMDGDRQKCLDAGMDDYISKPFMADDFRKILLRWTYDEGRPNLRLLPGDKRENAL